MVPIFILVIVVTLTGTRGVFAYTVGDDGEPVHEYISDQARALYTNAEIDAYIDTIKSGAEHEDLHDHIWDRYGFAGACLTLTHFWNADGGPNDPVSVGGCNGHNAWEKAQVLWGMAVGEYNSGDLTSAYEYLGHVTHLLADMSVPAHAHEEAHGPEPFDDDSYEDWMTLANAELKDDEPAALLAQGPVVIPDNVDPLYYLFYTTNQVADFFPDDSNDGDTVDNHGGWMDGIYTELGMYSIDKPRTRSDLSDNDNGDNNDDGDLGVIRHYSFKYAIRAVAALYEVFTESVSGRPALTVVIDRIEAKDCHDELLIGGVRDADFFVRVSISDVQQNEFWFRNEGDQVEDEQTINPGWAFARDVGLSGIVRIVIQVWDEDDDGTIEGGDDKSDIDPGGGYDLDFDVNLATGEISGPDITGTCGTQLTSIGNDDSSDQSRIYFTVILPNIPPTAHAGDDQTVNEGDTVTLEGTFTDPNVGDTHTFLWHMESSTNGQVIPDSSGPASPEPSTQSFSFVPCDNGVYTFNFTVTDNYGAQGSDTVVVTVLNVPPVASAPYISNQENAQFILPMVHNTSFEGTFTDAGTCDTHAALWAWGDGTTSNGNVTETNGSGSVTNAHTYSQPGDYTITLTVTDDDGGTDSKIMTIHVADVDEALDIFNTYIQSLPNSRFKNSANQRKAAFDNMFLSLDNMLDVEDYQGMILSMNSNMRGKFDGLVGGNPKNDWIKQDLATQTELCQKVDDITAYLEYLLSLMP